MFALLWSSVKYKVLCLVKSGCISKSYKLYINISLDGSEQEWC